MSSEPMRQPDPRPRPRRPANDGGASAADLAGTLGYDQDDPATWPGNAPAPAAAEADGADGGEGGAAEGKPLFLTDPKAIRALAHPLRVALVELFGAHSTLTATQASEILGESPANCAFHLRTLAKYGFLEEAGGGRGRERPWRSVNTSITLSQDKLEDELAPVAADALGLIWLDRLLGRIRKVVGGRQWPADWEGASGTAQSIVFLAPDEALALREEFRVLIDRYISRRDDPSQRPAGALPFEISTFYFPREDLTLPAGQPEPDAAAEDDEAAD